MIQVLNPDTFAEMSMSKMSEGSEAEGVVINITGSLLLLLTSGLLSLQPPLYPLWCVWDPDPANLP